MDQVEEPRREQVAVKLKPDSEDENDFLERTVLAKGGRMIEER